MQHSPNSNTDMKAQNSRDSFCRWDEDYLTDGQRETNASAVAGANFLGCCLACAAFLAAAAGNLLNADDFEINRCEVIPLADHQVSFQVDGVEKLRWHYGTQYPRPFFFPFNGPSGVSLTRMGHPGAQNHDHHRSVWFAHHSVNGTNYWADSSEARIRQNFWFRYRDGKDEAVMAAQLGWFDESDTQVMLQDFVVALLPLPNNEHAVEFQIALRPPESVAEVTLDKTNFGLLAVRVSKTLSAVFGGGKLSDSEGNVTEKQIFGKQARWVDYSGPVVVGQRDSRHVVSEGITYFDHPNNPRYPTHWHVRQDGWMGASYGMMAAQKIDPQNPLILRYLLHAHSGTYDAEQAEAIHEQFAARSGFEIRKPLPGESHRQYEVQRISARKAGAEK